MSHIVNHLEKYKKYIIYILLIFILPLIFLLTEIIFNGGRVIGTLIRMYIEQGIC